MTRSFRRVRVPVTPTLLRHDGELHEGSTQQRREVVSSWGQEGCRARPCDLWETQLTEWLPHPMPCAEDEVEGVDPKRGTRVVMQWGPSTHVCHTHVNQGPDGMGEKDSEMERSIGSSSRHRYEHINLIARGRRPGPAAPWSDPAATMIEDERRILYRLVRSRFHEKRTMWRQQNAVV